MNTKKFIMALAIAALGTLTSHAEDCDWDGLRVAYNQGELKSSPMTDLKGASVGYSSLTRLSHSFPLCLETGFYANWYGKSENAIKTNLVDLSIPLNLGVKVDLARKIAIMPYAGLNFKTYVLAMQKVNGQGNINYFSTQDTGGHPYERWHAGWHYGVDLQLGCIIVGVNHGQDFTKFAPLNDNKFTSTQVRLGVNL